jgi:hypothetical protein
MHPRAPRAVGSMAPSIRTRHARSQVLLISKQVERQGDVRLEQQRLTRQEHVEALFLYLSRADTMGSLSIAT